MRIPNLVLLVAWMVAFGEPCLADDAPFEQRLSIVTTVITEELVETVVADDIVIRSQSAVGMFGQIPVLVNDYFHDVEILDAATIKADGRELKVPSDQILLSSLPNSPQLGIFQADVRTHTIVFPDVSVGDTVRYKVRFRAKRPAIPGGFSSVRAILPSGRFGSVLIVLDSPKTIQITDASAGFTRQVEESGERRKVSWTLIPQPYQADEPRAVAAIDRGAYVAYSSYPSWEAIGKELLQQSAPMSVPTPELRQLADSITQGITDRREQARAIFDWVSTNIRYLAIFLGTGGFVPHEAGAVLANKFGDCKDHATLMRALLAAKDIEADYVFISAAPIYRDLTVPGEVWFNHAILWLPEFELYVDPTASHAALSALPDIEADKVVLRFGKTGVVLDRTPALKVDGNQISILADVAILPDGTSTGTSTVTASGYLGIQLRNLMAEVALKGGEDVAKRLLASQNWRGSANIEPREPTDHSEPYAVRTHFTLSNKFLSEEGNRNPVPLGPRLVSPVWQPYLDWNKTKPTQPFVCQAATYQQLIDLRFPEGKSISNLPAQVTISKPMATYEASYQSTDQGLHISRRLVIAVPHQSCSSAQAGDIAPVIEAAVKDFGWHPQFGHMER
jgi:transglutaminase-like putative cysteine protease